MLLFNVILLLQEIQNRTVANAQQRKYKNKDGAFIVLSTVIGEAKKMPMLQIGCVTKTSRQSPAEKIQSVGGASNGQQWKLSQSEVIRQIESGENEFRMGVNGKTTQVIVAVYDNKKYIRTEADRVGENKLLSLPACP